MIERYLIKLKECQAEMLLGVYEHEKKTKRPVVANVTLELDPRQFPGIDEMSQVIDYAQIEMIVIKCLGARHYHLIETLAKLTAQEILAFDLRIQAVTIEINKPGALTHTKNVAVAITCRR